MSADLIRHGQSDKIDISKTELELVEEVDVSARLALIIALNRAVPEHMMSLDFLRRAIPDRDAVNQIDASALIILIDSNGRTLKVLKNEADVDEILEVHRAAIG